MRRLLPLLLPAALLAASLPAGAEQPMDGLFVASRACPALVSIRKDSNPGNVETEAGRAYALLAGNRKKPTHYRIEVPGAVPPERWVEAGCGKPAAGQPQQGASPSTAPRALPSYVLAISWQPAFCEANARKPECRSQTAGRADARGFSLHGLWPQPSTRAYCSVTPEARAASEDGRWQDLPDTGLDTATRAKLETAMPGTMSFLDRHEFTKHGTCYPTPEPGAYYRDSLRLLDEVNSAGLAGFMTENTGRSVSTEEIRARFDQAFGPGAGQRVRVACRDDGGRRLIAELTLGLRGDIPGGTPLAELLKAAGPTDPGCPAGVVDPAGLQ